MMKIALLAGDGIGPEITAQAIRVVEALGRHGLEVELESALVGGAAYDADGDPLPPQTLAVCESAQAVLFGAVGGPRYDTLPRAMRPEQGLLRLRKHFDLFANLRPAIVYPELAHASSLRPDVVAGLDLLILRELTGDIYFGQPRGIHRNERGEREGFDTMRYNESEIGRIARWGFEAARKRQRRLCSVDKANVLETTQLWRDVVTEVHKDYPDVELSHMYVDNAAGSEASRSGSLPSGALPPALDVLKKTGSISSKSPSARIRSSRTDPTIPRQPTRPTRRGRRGLPAAAGREVLAGLFISLFIMVVLITNRSQFSDHGVAHFAAAQPLLAVAGDVRGPQTLAQDRTHGALDPVGRRRLLE